MRINSSVFRKKCLSEKYYASIKYMSHALKGDERRNFIKRVCDINIYLGCQCARTCEQDNETEKYIRKKINNYFKPQTVTHYDSAKKKREKTVRRLRSFDIANYLLACNLMGQKKAINWYIYNHSVQKSILIQLAAEMDENQLLDFMLTVSRSELNNNKLRGIGSTKNLYQKKNDVRLKEILSNVWNIDKDAFIQLEYDTGLLQDLWKTSKNGKSVYIHLLNKCVKQKLALGYIMDVLGEKVTIDILKKSVVGQDFLYLVFLDRLQNGECLSDEEYKAVKELPAPPEKIRNYFIPFFLRLKKPTEYMSNVDYSKLWDSFGKLYTPLSNSKVKVKVGRTNSRALGCLVRSVALDEWDKIVELYFKTCISETTSFDDLFRQLNRYHNVQIDELLPKVHSYSLEIKMQNDSYQFCRIKTENYIVMKDEMKLSEGTEVHICDYDYIKGVVYVEEDNN